MKRPLVLASFGAAVLILLSLLSAGAAPRQGHLVLVGGGSTPAAVFTRTLELSGGRAASVAVLSQTYPNDTIAEAAVAMWKEFHPREIVMVSRTDAAAARAAVERATLIWMPGGFQGLLMKAIAVTPIADQIRARFAAGVTIGGSSAGAAAMSRVMIADETTPYGVGIIGAATDVGLGLWPEAIVSPHFTERLRMNHLVSIVQGHPGLLGVGIDEGTAVIVDGGKFEILGRGTVTVLDGRRLTANGTERAPVQTLRAGMQFRFARS